MDPESRALSTTLVPGTDLGSKVLHGWGVCSLLEARWGDCSQSPGGQAAQSPPLPASHGPRGPLQSPLQAVASRLNCLQFPLGTLRALGRQLSWRDASPVPGGRGPHVPHMPPGWDFCTEQLSCPLFLLPLADFPASLLFVCLPQRTSHFRPRRRQNGMFQHLQGLQSFQSMATHIGFN